MTDPKKIPVSAGRFYLLVFLLLAFSTLRVHAADTRPIKFIPNHGQWADNVLYRALIPGGVFYLEKDQITYHFYDGAALHAYFHDHKPVDHVQNHVVRIKFSGSAGINMIVPDQQCSEYYNYIFGKDPSKWASHLNAFGRLVLPDIWPGIDMEIVGQNTSIKYTFIVHPKADPSLIRLQYTGMSNIALAEDTLKVHTTLVNLSEHPPVAYQMASYSGAKTGDDSISGYSPVSAHYRLSDSTVSFQVGRYNRHETLTIDPILVFSTFSGSIIDNWGFTGTYNNEGNGYSGGIVFGSGYPVKTGAFQTTFHGGHSERDPQKEIFATDCGILKYSPDGSQLLWATYLGGKDNEEPHSMVVNSLGDLIIFGTTFSADFPVTSNVFSNSLKGGSDIFVAKMASDGASMLACTFLGGSDNDGLNDDNGTVKNPLKFNYGDKYRGEVIVDKNDNILIASCTQSNDFPIRNGFQSRYRDGNQDACVARFSPDLKQLQFSTYLGGNDFDAAYGINMDSKGNIFVAGGTNSGNFPTTNNVSQPFAPGSRDGFLAKISPDGSQLLSSTYVGTNSYDQAFFVQLDNFDRVYVTGQTLGNFPVSNGVYFNANGRQFIAVFSNNLNQMLESTVYGSGRSTVDISPSAFLVDICGRVYVSGWGGIVNSIDNDQAGTTYNMPITQDAFQSKTDGSDFYLAIFGQDLKKLVYGTYFGGAYTPEHVDGGTSRFDREGKVYQSVCGGCGGLSDFPTTPNAWSRVNRGKRTPEMSFGGDGGCNNAMFKIDLNSSDFPPQFNDTLFTVYAGSVIDYSFNITTPDHDSIYVKASSSLFGSKIPAGSIGFRADSAMDVVKAHFFWKTQCNNVSTDTYTVSVTARNNSCPVPRTITHKIKIVVKEPPIPAPPAVFCLERIDSHTVKVNWDEFTTGWFFANYKLVKKFPDGHVETVKTIKTTKDLSYTDVRDTGLYTHDYQYLIYGSNICNSSGDSTRWLHSVPDPDSIPKPVYIYTATVESDKYIRLTWSRYQREDFYYYYLYRKENKPGSQFELYRGIKDQKDTTFLDSDVDVHARSYCYKVVVHNQCGLYSPDPNIGCSIFLSGTSQPFEHHLKWNAYQQWPAGVCRYQVHRWDPSKADSVVGASPGNTPAFIDDSLNYDQGIYWYKVVADECINGKNQHSVSNAIKLIQAPYLYIPNAFTPNGDGLNDRWQLVPVFVKTYHLKIFDAWGGFVWETYNKHETWDGKYKGGTPFNNVFIWQTEYSGWDNSNHYLKGNVTTLP